MPATTTVPPGRARAIAWANAAGALAVTSTTTSARPPVAVLQRADRIVDGRRRRRGRRRSRRRSARRSASRGPDAGDHHEPGAGVLGGGRRATGRGRPDRGRRRRRPAACRARSTAQRMPAPSGLNSVASDRVEPVGHRQQHRVGPEVQVRGVAAPQPGRVSTSTKPYMSPGRGARSAGRRRPRQASHVAARLEHLDGDPIAGLATPHRSAARAPTCSMMPTTSWPGMNGVPGADVPGVLLVVGAAEPARLDAQQPVVVADVGESNRRNSNRRGRGEHERRRRSRAHPAKAARAVRIASTARGSPAYSARWVMAASISSRDRPWRDAGRDVHGELVLAPSDVRMAMTASERSRRRQLGAAPTPPRTPTDRPARRHRRDSARRRGRPADRPAAAPDTLRTRRPRRGRARASDLAAGAARSLSCSTPSAARKPGVDTTAGAPSPPGSRRRRPR